MNQFVRLYAGYDPGGNGNHGFALLTVKGCNPCKFCVDTLKTTEAVLARIRELPDLAGLGVDTLTCWSTAESGWRPADRRLRKMYPEAQNSVMPPNSLRGSMCINGMAAILVAKEHHPELYVTETHPKAVYLAMTKKKYNFAQNSEAMINQLSRWAKTPVKASSNEHEWDAAISALAAYYGDTGEWAENLHNLSTECGESLVYPAGPTCYAWPDKEKSGKQRLPKLSQSEAEK